MNNRHKSKEKRKLNKTITPQDHISWIGKVICKHSGKKFTTDEKIAIPSGIETNRMSGKQGFVLEDGSLIDCYQCKLFEPEVENKLTCTVFEHIERGTRFFTNYAPYDVTEGLKIVCHCETVEQAQDECRKTEGKNFAYYYLDLLKQINWGNG